MTALSQWQNFYVIVGSSAGALIGLQFVVMALVAGMPGGMPARPGSDAEAFATPTIVHFGTVLLTAAMMSMPWHRVKPAAMVLALIGMVGLVYSISITRRLRKQTAYTPQLEDWLCHCALPIVAYAGMLASACAALQWMRGALFGVAAATMLLLFIGIHNAWDTAAWHVFVSMPRRAARKAAEEKVEHGD
jgi:hypothetical protein